MALPARMRFRERNAVRRVIARGFRIEIPLGRVSVLPAETEQGRILFVASTRVAKKSTNRHAIKRQLDEWARAHEEVVRGLDVVVHVRADSANLGLGELLNRARTLPAVVAHYRRKR